MQEIFLPAGGYYYDTPPTSPYSANTWGHYWTATYWSQYDACPMKLYASGTLISNYTESRYYGRAIRSVR